jgi:hypothetical protein
VGPKKKPNPRQDPVMGRLSSPAPIPLAEDRSVSHIVTIEAEARDPAAIASACRRLGLPAPVMGTARLFDGEASGLLVRLPGWLYPAVIEAGTGYLRYDNYGGQWGDPAQLGLFLQAYALERATIEARKKGHTVTEQTLADGSVKLTVTVGGGA